MFYLFAGNGFEELEFIAPLDIMRRAGLKVTTVGIGGRTVTGAHGLTITCDTADDQLIDGIGISGVILPGGAGYRNLAQSATVGRMLAYCVENNLLIAAICAAPSILGEFGILRGRRATCFPGFEDKLEGAIAQNDAVVRDGNLITAKGAGCAVDFGLEIVRAVLDDGNAVRIASAMQCHV
ncbi:MAG: DJ-1/PfpI family protein [Oscillospiraceae bacterium]|nr:DJ-1/PfpI family protein [Oscillospiraceae bacterium]